MALTKVSNSMITGAVVNVLDYGENTIPGTTDMAAAINNAITAAYATQKSVFLPAGVYRCTTPILLQKDYGTLFGEGGLSVIWGDHAGYALTVGSTILGDLTYAYYINNISVWSPTGSGILFTGAINSIFTDLWAFSKLMGFTLQNQTQTCTFNGLTFTSNNSPHLRSLYPSLPAFSSTQHGIHMANVGVESNGNVFNYPVIEGAGQHGFTIEGLPTRTSINDALIEGCALYGIYANGTTAIPDNYGQFLSIKDSYMEANGSGAMYLVKQMAMTISGMYGSYGVPSVVNKIELYNVINSFIYNMESGGVTMDAGCVGNTIAVNPQGSSDVFAGAGVFNNTFISYAPSVPQTSTAAGESIVDTGITTNSAMAFIVTVSGITDVAAGQWSDTVVGVLKTMTGLTGGQTDAFIYFDEIGARTPPGKGNLTVTPKFLIGATQYDSILNSLVATATIRLRISGYTVGSEGASQVVKFSPLSGL